MFKLTLTADRKLTAISMDNFQINFNGLENTAYKAALAPLGVVLEFVADSENLEERAEYQHEQELSEHRKANHD